MTPPREFAAPPPAADPDSSASDGNLDSAQSAPSNPTSPPKSTAERASDSASEKASESDPKNTKIALVDYTADRVNWVEAPTIADYQRCRDPQSVSWLDLQGAIDADDLQAIGDACQLDPAAIETLLRPQRRAQIEEYDRAIAVVFRMVACNGDRFRAQQIVLILGEGWLISLQEQTDYDCFAPVRARLRAAKGSFRKSSVDYLAYSLIDATIDSFFPVLENYGERIAVLEEEAIVRPHPTMLQTIYQLRRELLELRRAVWPQRHAINLLSRGSGEPIVSDRARMMLRDSYDRLMQVLETIETYRELSSGLMDIYLSALGQKTNEVMKTLTVISTIFIPLTFVAGIYGMNFNTERSPFNMPELNWMFGYPLCLTLMATIAGGTMFYFWRRGWFSSFADFDEK
ncbi:MAG: magnesium/cobalt transporter CorA [Geitlerinemataceae cyanobacterium]